MSWLVEEWADRGGGADPPLYIAPLHIHRDDDEAWCVLEGRLVVRLGGRDVELGPGDGVMALRGVPHAGDHAAIFAAHASELLGWP
jgi:mannose-6-phosphate isomerase-like protein (cupin superfamily)